MIRRGIGVQSFVSAGVSTDADAQAFITAAGITDATQQSAINTLVTNLKGYGIWTKMKAIYPFVGGTSSTHKWNLKDPRDLDAAFRLVFSGGWTHSSTGALPNGTNGYADTKLTTSTVLLVNNAHMSVYLRTSTQASSTQVDIGCADTPAALPLMVSNSTSQTIRTNICWDYTSNQHIFNETDSRGMWGASRVSSSLWYSFTKNTIVTRNINNTYSNLPAYSMFLGALNYANTTVEYSQRQIAFATIGDGLNNTEFANLYTAVQAYQTTLSRNV